MTKTTEDGKQIQAQKKACYDAGCHDFTEPVIVSKGWSLFSAKADVAVIFCRRCGAAIWYGWQQELIEL